MPNQENHISIKVKRSKLMLHLYGEKQADIVYERLNFLDPMLNKEIQEIAYDHFWALEGLSLKIKSLVTVSSLIALKKEEQTRIHMHGFLNVGGTADELALVILSLERLCGRDSKEKALDALFDVLDERGEGMVSRDSYLSNVVNIRLLPSYEHIANLCAATATGQKESINAEIRNCLNAELNDSLQPIFIHQIVYCGFPVAMNAFAELRNVLNEHNVIQMSSIEQSNMMSELYGNERAKIVYDRLNFLDPLLNEEIQKIAYDHFWALDGLSIRLKSMVTVASLIALKKEEQTRIHMHGFLNAGGKVEELVLMANQFEISCGVLSKEKAFHAIADVLAERGINSVEISSTISNSLTQLLSDEDRLIANLSAAVAIGKKDEIQAVIVECLEKGLEEKIQFIFIHQIVYCGFPVAMNAFAELRNVMRNRLENRGMQCNA